jgi:MOSC domain-containing protein YiiM
MQAAVVSVNLSSKHTFSKAPVESITLLAGLGVEGDAHCGALVKHRYRVKQDPTQPNLCQVHLLPSELFDELAASGFMVAPGAIGENITTRGVDLINLPVGTLMQLGETAQIEVTGLRSPCVQINRFQPGLLPAVLEKEPSGKTIRKAGIMAIVRSGGLVKPGDTITITLPERPWRALVCV